ncbi:Smr/MutS family protein [Xinfangfangia sp. CPCC 101601]|uniref:Smr/MutS family protein n=1 Tax=Pseudogemmobacter lacusdianii TaxID=3069608 RepID=A0ABU0VTY8_9RHOB|nr:Smr/MutS family protein [Xinfangfangia sp. CPCC 101601]MDQ2065189.1 Smr/MutS family protein [Xinfangfangia sp. CPCC 101601]
MARRRTLRPEEADLWQAVARTTRAMHSPAPPSPHLPLEPAPVAPPAPKAEPRLTPFRLGERPLPQPPAAKPQPALRMDARTHDRMLRGKLAPDSRIDLHGMTLAQAHGELIHFILNAQSSGHRLVLVITGKGRIVHDPLPRPMGALRHQVPHWLRLSPLAQAVQQVEQANLKHGGAGALYVYLRRR